MNTIEYHRLVGGYWRLWKVPLCFCDLMCFPFYMYIRVTSMMRFTTIYINYLLIDNDIILLYIYIRILCILLHIQLSFCCDHFSYCSTCVYIIFTDVVHHFGCKSEDRTWPILETVAAWPVAGVARGATCPCSRAGPAAASTRIWETWRNWRWWHGHVDIHCWLVVWNMNFMTFHFHLLWTIIPIDELIFFRGVGIPPSRLEVIVA